MCSRRLVPLAALIVLAACGGGGGDAGTGPSPTPTSNKAPTAKFAASCAALTCSFTDQSADAGGAVTAWSWHFGDDSTSTDQNPVHTYATAQPYTVTLAVTDDSGATASTTQNVTPQAPSADLTCTDAATPGTDATCTFTLPQAAAITAVIAPHDSCQAHGDVFAFTAPVADTLTTDGCAAAIGTQTDIAAQASGTVFTIAIRSGLPQYTTGVHVTGQYPQWTINVEDAVGAPFPANYTDLIVTIAATPSGP
jgi:PKD repeat protein